MILSQNVVRVKFSDLTEIKEKLRKLDPERVKVMEEAIKSVGLLNRPTLCKRPDGKYFIGDGAHRIQALINLKYTEADFNVDDSNLSEHEVLHRQLIGNNVSSKTSSKDIIRAIYLLTLGDNKKTVPEIAALYGMSERTVHNYLSFRHFPEEVQELIGKGDGMIPITRIIRVKPLLGKIDDEEMLEFLTRELTTDEFAQAVDARHDEIKNGVKASLEPGYNHKPKRRSEDEVRARLANTSDPEAVELLKWFIGEDQATVEAGRMEWEIAEAEKKAKREAEKAKREAEKAIKGEKKADGGIQLLNS